MQENLKLLLKYIVDSFWEQLEKFEYLVSIQSLKVKYEQVFSSLLPSSDSAHWFDPFHVCLQCLDNGGTKGTATVTDPRRRIEERALEKEEEDYFNEDRYISFLRIVGDSKQLTSSLTLVTESVMKKIQLLHPLAVIRKDSNNSLIYPMELLQATHRQGRFDFSYYENLIIGIPSAIR